MTQQVDPWDIPVGGAHGLGQRDPPPQTPDQATHQRLSNVALQQQIEQAGQHLDPATIDMLAHQYILAGPQALQGAGGMGRAAAANRMAILNRAAQIAGARPGEDVQVGFSRYRNGVHALQTLENQLGTISGNEQSARGYAEQVLSAIRQVYPPNSTMIGNMGRALYRDVMNDPNMAAFDSARNTFLTEYGKVVAGSPSGAGVLSDSARREQMDVLRRTTSPEAAEGAINQMRRDMEIRLQALQGNIQRGYQNLESGHPISFNPQGEMLDEHGAIIPVARTTNRNDSAVPPVLGHPPATPPGPSPGPTVPGTPPVPGAPRGGERMDATTVNMGARGPDDVSLNTSAMQRVADPALAGLNAHVAEMLRPGPNQKSDAEIRQYIQDRGVPIEQVPGIDAVLTWRAAHPDYTGAYDVDLDKHLVPQSLTRQVMTNVGDSAPGAAVVAAGNMVAGQQIPALVGATGGDPELARLGMAEIRNRHGPASLVGDVAGGAMLYNAGGRAVELGLTGIERAAPTIAARLPAWVTGRAAATGAEELGSGAGTWGADATGTLSPRAIAGDAAIGGYESPNDRLSGAALGVGAGMGTRGVINSVGRAVSPTGGPLAPAYEEGVQPTLGQRMGGVWNRMEQAYTSLPIIGGIQRGARNQAIDQWQLGGFNRALRNLPDDVQLPAGTEPGTAPHAFAQDAFDRAYDRVHQRISVVPDDQLEQDLGNIRQQANTLLPDSSISHFNRIMDNSVLRRLTDPTSEAAGLSGDELQQALSEIRRAARSQRTSANGDRELAGTLDDLSQAIYDNAARHSAPEAIQTLNNINRGYGMLVRIENAANRAGQGDPGEYTAKSLLNAERQQGGLRGRQFLAGDGLMSDYAQAGMRLGQTVADSGTPERLAILGATGAGFHYVSPALAAPWAVDTIANAPGVRSVVDFLSRPNSPAIRPFTDDLRAQIQARAGVGSALGLPAVVAAYGSGQ